jgi:hypothetical protein
MVALSSVEASVTITLTVPFCGVGVGVCVGVGVVALLALPQPVDRTIIEVKARPGKRSRNETLHCILLERSFRLSIVFFWHEPNGMRPDTLGEPADQLQPVSWLNPVPLEKFRGGGQLFGAAEASMRPCSVWARQR